MHLSCPRRLCLFYLSLGFSSFSPGVLGVLWKCYPSVYSSSSSSSVSPLSLSDLGRMWAQELCFHQPAGGNVRKWRRSAGAWQGQSYQSGWKAIPETLQAAALTKLQSSLNSLSPRQHNPFFEEKKNIPLWFWVLRIKHPHSVGCVFGRLSWAGIKGCRASPKQNLKPPGLDSDWFPGLPFTLRTFVSCISAATFYHWSFHCFFSPFCIFSKLAVEEQNWFTLKRMAQTVLRGSFDCLAAAHMASGLPSDWPSQMNRGSLITRWYFFLTTAAVLMFFSPSVDLTGPLSPSYRLFISPFHLTYFCAPHCITESLAPLQ